MPAIVELPSPKESGWCWVVSVTEPRSTTFASMPFQRILAGLISRWMRGGCWACMYSKGVKAESIIAIASWGGSLVRERIIVSRFGASKYSCRR